MVATRRAQPGAFQASGQKPEDWFSYLAEARRISATKLRSKAAAHLNGSEGAITDYLDRVYRRVWNRRSGADMPTKPPLNWREEVRPFLTDLLRSTD